MKLILCGVSAIDAICTYRWNRSVELLPANIQTLSDCAHTLGQIESISIPAFDQSEKQLEVLVPSNGMKYRSSVHRCKVLNSPLKSGMFCRIDRNAYVTSPEMTFAQMALRLPLLDLVLLGMEWCGTYAFRPYGNAFDERPPVTSKESIVSFCERAKGMRGATKALKAAHWLADNSNSPAETALLLYLCLPVRMGGYGFKYPDMNPETPLGKRAGGMYGYDKMRCDLHWVKERVVVEYDSDQEHLSSKSASTDASRRNVLGYKGVEVISVRSPMIATPAKFDAVVRQLANKLGRKLRMRDLEFTNARADLRVKLFPWLKNGW